MGQYFDFHFHPLFKQFLVEFDDEKRKNNRWEKPIRIPLLGRIADLGVGNILESQCCVSDSIDGKVEIGVANLIAVEHAMGNRTFVFRLLEHNAIAPLDERYFQFVREGQGSYFDLLEKELKYYQWTEKVNESPVNIISRKNGSLPKQLKKNKLNLMVALEGGHNLSKRIINELVGIQNPVGVVKELRERKDLDILYLILTHVSHIREQPLCSHAFGFKLINLPVVKPQITGITELGKAVIKACMMNLNSDSTDITKEEYPILIDIKHMSLASRVEFYNYRKCLLNDGNFKTSEKGWPILASHIGVTGFGISSLDSRIVEYGSEDLSVRIRTKRERAGDIGQGESVFFNSWTINLLDEDIEEIARSGGLIGIILDARVLGFEGLVRRARNRFFEEFSYDYLSRGDFSRLFPEKSKVLPKATPLPEEALVPETSESLKKEELFGLANRKERELFLFCLNVLHVVAVINSLVESQSFEKPERKKKKNAKLSGWDFVAIGSDFDGLIDSVKACQTIKKLPDFEETLIKYLPKAEQAYRGIRNNVPPLLPRINGNFDASTFQKIELQKLLYANGKEFLEWWFEPASTGPERAQEKMAIVQPSEGNINIEKGNYR